MTPRAVGLPLKRVLQLLVFALVVHLFVIPQIGGTRRALDVLGTVDPTLIGLVIVLEGLSLVAYARLTRSLIPEAHRPSLPITFGTVVASTGVNHVLPGGAATTAAVNYRLLGRAGVPTGELAFALGTQAIGSAVVLNAILWCALVVSIPVSGLHPVYGSAAAVGAVLITIASLAVVAMLRSPDRFAERVARIVGRLPRVDQDRVRRAVLGIAGQVRVLAEDRRRLVTVSTAAAMNWLLDAAALWVAVAAFGPAPGIVGLLVAYGLANVMAAVPVSPGGLGVIEAILIPTLVAFGTPSAQAAIAVVAYRLANFWLPIPVGAACLVIVERATAGADRIGFRAELERVWSRIGRRRPESEVASPPQRSAQRSARGGWTGRDVEHA
jgi:uncharacterized protein (TIRG00374 family)